jgi:formylglycine-generating enzyme required for sulfatase activity/tetratricopeptide (TPR) repeat protein
VSQARAGPGPEELARFRTEAEAVARLQHPHIVQIHQIADEGERPFLLLEYVAGGSLARKLGGTPLPAAEAARLVETLARAAHHAHERGIVHRDLTPGNVLLAADGTPKITDFGLAKLITGAGPTQTRTGAVLGTPSYMAPEQAAGGSKRITPAVDVYALGAILYDCLTGRPPFKAETVLETLRQVMEVEPVSPNRLQPSVPRDLETIALKCLRKEPSQRYAGALDLAEDLRRFLANEPIRARPVGRAERLRRWARRNPAVAALAAIAALLLLTVAVVSSVSALGLRRARDAVLASHVQALLTASPDSVPFILETLKAHKVEVLPTLPEPGPPAEGALVKRLRLNVARAALGEDRLADLCALVAETPPAESFNLVIGLKCCDQQEARAQLDALYRQAADDTTRCRLAIALLELGDPGAGRDELALRANPTRRVHFIHLFPTWHGDLAAVPDLLRSVDDPAFRSGLCVALGGIDPARLPSDARQTLDAVLAELYATAPDGGTHSAADWALRRRGSSLPAIPLTRGPAEGRRWFVNGQGMTLVGVEPGLFQPKDYEYPPSWGGPLQTVVLTRPFFICDQVVTAEWYRRFLDSDDHPDGEKLTRTSRPPDQGDGPAGWAWGLPTLSYGVADVNWPSAILFCNWLSRAEGRTPCYRPDAGGRLGLTCDFGANGYRLPTDAELEYVFRCETTTRFVIGDDVVRTADCGRVFALRVGPGKIFRPNPWGLFDPLGNWWQMAWDVGHTQDAPRLVINPVGAAGGDHAIRGGSFDAGPYHFPASYRGASLSEDASLFRPVCGPLDAGADRDVKAAALMVLTRTLERFPESRPQVWKERGRLYADLGQHEKAAADFARALELAPGDPWIADDAVRQDELFARVVAARPQDAGLWLSRGAWMARCRRWPEAAAATGRSVELGPDNFRAWYFDAVLRLQTGDLEGYRRDCRELLTRCRGMQTHYTVDMAAKTCLLLPDAVADLDPVLQLARRPLTGMEKDFAYRWLLICKALAEYRAGQFGAAVEAINKVAPKTNGECVDATAYTILALAELGRGRPAEARVALASARVIAVEIPLRPGNRQQPGGTWDDWLRYDILRREAAELLNKAERSGH